MPRVIVDSDSLVYATGFSVERTRYDVTVQRPDGSEAEVICASKDEVEAFLSDEPEGTVHQIDKVVEAEPLNHATFLVDRMLNTIDTNLTQAGVEFERLELFLTGQGNFREELATIRPYKGNRDASAKPYHYKSIRRYMANKWGAKIVDGCEADDMVASIMYWNKDAILVGIDKDLLTIPGRHYNFRKKVLFEVSKQEALVNFYRQLIVGDPVDNILGAYKAGPAKAEALAPEWTEVEMYEYTLGLYARGLEMKNCPYANLSAEAALLENARLLHLKRDEDDIWAPPRQRPVPEGEFYIPLEAGLKKA